MGIVDELPLVVYPRIDLISKKPGSYPVALEFGTEDICNPPVVSTMIIEFPMGGGRRDVPLPRGPGTIPYEPKCLKNTGHVAFLDSDAPPPSEPAASPLRATLISVGPLRPNERLRFVVRISNPSSDVVSLDPCPSYIEGLKSITTESYQLNCSTIRTIAAGRAIDYEMFLSIPAVSASKLDRPLLIWSFNGGGGPSFTYAI